MSTALKMDTMTARGRRLLIDTAPVFEPLLAPSRYKGAHGGRGSGKSWFFAGKLVEDHLCILGLRSVCIREVQKTLSQSSKLVIEDTIERYKVQGFRVLTDHIVTPGNGRIIFTGMNDFNAESIKSLEHYGRAWVEEAQTLSDRSLKLLRPTIRDKGSELWFSWNGRRKSDPVDKLLRQDKPDNAIVVCANWRDNPWFSAEMEAERQLDLGTDDYEHIWEGAYVTVFKGAYYADCLRQARREQRIGFVARDPNFALRAYWDLGGPTKKSDAMAVWLTQFVGREIRVLAYIEGVGQALGYYLNWLREMGATGCECVLPHDGTTVHVDNPTGAHVERQLHEAGFKARTVPNQGQGAAMQRIQVARRMWPRVWINEKACADGLEALGAYQPHFMERDGESRDMGPDHNWASHGCDAFGLMCIDYREPSKRIGRLEVPNYAGA